MTSFICGVCLFVLARWLLFDDDTAPSRRQTTFAEFATDGTTTTDHVAAAQAQLMQHVLQSFGDCTDPSIDRGTKVPADLELRPPILS